MKTASGFTSEDEALQHGKYVVAYSSGVAAQTYYVPFRNRRTATQFAKEHGMNDPDASPRHAACLWEID